MRSRKRLIPFFNSQLSTLNSRRHQHSGPLAAGAQPARWPGRPARLRVGEPLSVEEISGWLVRGGFQNTTAVELPGEFSHRGGIIDIFAPDWFHPVRIELFGDEIESIRRFEVASQRSLERVWRRLM